MYQKTAAARQRKPARSITRRSAISWFRILFLILCFFILLTIIHLAVSGESVVEANTAPAELKYKLVEVTSGDTIWDIAKANYSSEFKDLNSYVYEIKTCNHITGNRIIPGNKLTIPYYE